jgi:hypothetical protein
METISFEVPIIGSSYTMFIDYLNFNFKNDHIIFNCHMKETPAATTTLYRTHKNHSDIIQFLTDNPFMPILMEKINKYKHHVSFEKNYENIGSILYILRLLFPQETISMEIILSHDYFFFGKCSFHLLDLYEMGYLSLVPVVIPNPFYQQHITKIYTGLFLMARNPFHKYNYDYVELNFFNNVKNDFLRLSFDMLLQDRPSMKKKLNALIKDMLTTIPLKEDVAGCTKLFHDWKQYHDIEIKMSDLGLRLKEWKPSLFLKSISRLLDMFPDYHISPRFNLDVSISL